MLMKQEFSKGALNKITDVAGVTVGHATVDCDNIHSGVTIINPTQENVFYNKPTAASYVLNGFGKTAGTIQINELGTLESPIALTNTLSVGAVLDALTKHAVKESEKLGKKLRSVNSVVCECNDGGINDISAFGIKEEHVEQAFANACKDFEEGAVGAGRGMICHGLKGGIGSASRLITLDGKTYTMGILLMSNHGSLKDLTIDGKEMAPHILNGINENDKGSIIVIMATDVPLTSRQIKRVLKRISTALARVGSRIGHGSGEVFIGFSTANIIKAEESRDIVPCFQLAENKMDILFRCVSETTEDALLKSMLLAKPCIANNGKTVYSLSEFVSQ
jgi:D-aminopeptidase